jgi:hypothetical protein
MTLPISPSTQNLYKGGGAIYLADRDDDGEPKGMVHLGNAPMFEGQPNVDYDEHFSSLVGTFEKDVSQADTVGFSFSGELEEYSPHNMNIAVLGDGIHAVSQGSGSIEAMAITVDRLDAWYKTGYHNIDNVVVTGYTEGTDYEVDTVNGLIKPLSAGSIAVDEELDVDFTYTAWTAEEVRPLENPTIEKYVHFIGNPKRGPMIDAEIWLARITINAAFPIITPDYGKIPFTLEVLSDRANHPSTPFGRFRFSEAT